MSAGDAPSVLRRLDVPEDGSEAVVDLAAEDAVDLIAGRPRPVSLIAEGDALRIDLGHDGSIVLRGFFNRAAAGETPLRMSGRAFPAPHVAAMLERARAQGRLDDDGLTAALDAEGLHLELADWMFAPAEPAPAPPPAAPPPAAAMEEEQPAAEPEAAPEAISEPDSAVVPGVIAAAGVAAAAAESFAESELEEAAEAAADLELEVPEPAAEAEPEADLPPPPPPLTPVLDNESEPSAPPVSDTGSDAAEEPWAAAEAGPQAEPEAPLPWQDAEAAEPVSEGPLPWQRPESEPEPEGDAPPLPDLPESDAEAAIELPAAVEAGEPEPDFAPAAEGDAPPVPPPADEPEEWADAPPLPPIPGYQPMETERHWQGDAEAPAAAPADEPQDWESHPSGAAGDWAEPPPDEPDEPDDQANREFHGGDEDWAATPVAAEPLDAMPEPAPDFSEPPAPPARLPAEDAAALAPDQMFELPDNLRPGTQVEGELLEHRPGPAIRLLVTGNHRTALGGSVRLYADGRFSYEPPRVLAPGERDGFAYRVGDEATEARGLVSLVAPGPPPANTLTLTGAEDLELLVDAEAGLLAGVVPDGERVQSIGMVLTDRGGSAEVEPEGGFRYLPPAGFSGVDRFDCAVETESGGVVTAAVAVTVAPAPAPSPPPPPPREEPDLVAEERAQQGAVGREYSIPVPQRAGVGSRVQLLLEPLAGPDGVDISHVVLEHFDGDTWRPFDSGDSVPVVEPGDALLVRVIAIDSRGRAVRRSLIQAHFQMGEIVNPIGGDEPDIPQPAEAEPVESEPVEPEPAELEPEVVDEPPPEDVFISGMLSTGAQQAQAEPELALEDIPLEETLPEPLPAAGEAGPDDELVAVVRRIAPGAGDGVLVELDVPLAAVPEAAQRCLIRLVDSAAPDEPPPLALLPEQVCVHDGEDWLPLAEDHTAEVPAGNRYVRVRVIDADPELVRQLTNPEGLVLVADPVDEDELMLSQPLADQVAGLNGAADDDVLVLDTPVTDDTEVVVDVDEAMPPLMIGPALVAGETMSLDAAAAGEDSEGAAEAGDEPADEMSAEAIARAVSAVSLEKAADAEPEVPFGLLPVPAEGDIVSASAHAPDAEGEEEDGASTIVIAANAPDILYAEDDLDDRMGLRSTSSLFEDFGDPWLDITLTPEELTLASPEAGVALPADGGPATAGEVRARTAIALVFNIDMSGSMAWSFDGTERPALLEARSRLGTVVQAIKDLLQAFVDDGFSSITRVRFQPFTDTFSEGDARTFETLSDLDAVGDYLDSIVAGGFTRYEPVLQATALWLGDPRNRAAHNIVYLLSDGSDATGFDPIGGGVREVYQGYNAPGRPSLRIYAYGLGQGSDDLEPEQMGELFQPADAKDPLLPTSGGMDVESQLIRVTAGANLFAVLVETVPILDPADVGALDTGSYAGDAADHPPAILLPPDDFGAAEDEDEALPPDLSGAGDDEVARRMEDLRRRMDDDLGDAPPLAAAAPGGAISLHGPRAESDDFDPYAPPPAMVRHAAEPDDFDPYAPPPPLPPDDAGLEDGPPEPGGREVSGLEGLSERL
ncbi:MAG: VWA domain-containing protein, partial [Rhodospirillaceae bacterium]|nr:VWA domain-containing protein [Rhodospirillaceae bacterium]